MTPAQKALILANAQKARHKASRVMRKRAEILVALEMTKRVGAKKVLKQALARL